MTPSERCGVSLASICACVFVLLCFVSVRTLCAILPRILSLYPSMHCVAFFVVYGQRSSFSQAHQNRPDRAGFPRESHKAHFVVRYVLDRGYKREAYCASQLPYGQDAQSKLGTRLRSFFLGKRVFVWHSHSGFYGTLLCAGRKAASSASQ